MRHSLLAFTLSIALANSALIMSPVAAQEGAQEAAQNAATEAPAAPLTEDSKLNTGITVNKVVGSEKPPTPTADTAGKLKCLEFEHSDNPIQQAVYDTATLAMTRDPEVVAVDEQLFKMQSLGKLQNTKEISRNFVHYLVNYRGVGPSSASANALMEKEINTSSKLSTELKWEKAIDEKYVDIVNACAEAADALDREASGEGVSSVNEANNTLTDLVGKAEADKLMAKFRKLRSEMPDTIKAQSPKSFGISTERSQINALQEAVLKQDPILAEVAEKLSKYQVKKGTEVVSGVVQGALGVAGLAPSFVGPAAQIVKTAFILSTGGSEENKLYKEVFLFKRLEVRSRTINHLATSSIRNYNIGTLTNRPFLAAYSKALMEQMTDQATIAKIIKGDTGTKLSSNAPTSNVTQAAPASDSKLADKLTDKPADKQAATEAELTDTPGKALEAD
ncbi:hypothetical protein BH11CYA1_BH11CYA1_02570 [soil metagenome]